MEAHASIYVPLVQIYVASPPEAWRPQPAQTVDDSAETVCTEVGSSADTEVPCGEEDWKVRCVYENPATWHQYEEGLWLKCSRLPLLDECYVVMDNGDYRPFGSIADFVRLAECMQHTMVVISVGGSCTHILRAGREEERMALKPGLRSLRCFPGNLGVLVTEQQSRRFAYLDATWRRDDKREVRPFVQNGLVIAALRNRESNHLCFW